MKELRGHPYFRSFIDGEDVRIVGNEELLYELQGWIEERRDDDGDSDDDK